MNLTHYFDISRFGLLLKTELYRSRKGVVMALVIIFGLLLTGIVIHAIFADENVFASHPDNYAFNLIVGGFILSSLAFNDLGNTLRRYHYLTLPASALEKFLSMWLLASVGWILVFTAAFFLYSLLANAIGNLLFGHITWLSFDPFGEIPLNAMRVYFVLQGIFLVGATQFKGYVFPKTLFALILFGMVCGIIAYLLMADMIHSDKECGHGPGFLKEAAVYQVWLVIQWLFWWALAPLCWVIAYLGLKEKEA